MLHSNKTKQSKKKQEFSCGRYSGLRIPCCHCSSSHCCRVSLIPRTFICHGYGKNTTWLPIEQKPSSSSRKTPPHSALSPSPTFHPCSLCSSHAGLPVLWECTPTHWRLGDSALACPCLGSAGVENHVVASAQEPSLTTQQATLRLTAGPSITPLSLLRPHPCLALITHLLN